MKYLLKLITSFILALFVGLVAAPTAHAVPPQNFQINQVVGTGLNGPAGFEIAPDGRVFILERTGLIKVVKNGQLLQTPFANLPSVASGDRGLIGIAFDPAFGIDNHYVYFYYTGTDLLNRLVRFDASGDVGTNGPFLLYQTNSPSQELHVGGSIQFGPDGRLYFAVGDNGYPPNAQNLSNPHGKILRINKDGSIPLDNPFVGQTGALPEIYAYGFRNPWRFQFDPTTGNMFGADVGDFTWEEMNQIRRGQNYGWPNYEGPCNALCGTTTAPFYAYNHNGQSASVTGGPIYRGAMFPAEYQGNVFFGDYAQGFIKRIVPDANGNAGQVLDFDLNAGSVVDMKIAPDGSMYYITYFPGRLYRVSYSTGNQQPRANASADDDKGIEPHTVTFSSAGSSDPDGDPLTYLWNFGDGTTSTQANPVKTYTVKGTYTVELTVSDGTNSANAVPLVIQVGTPPQLTVGSPTEGQTYRAGDTINYTAHAIDAAGFDMNDSDIKTEIFLQHDTHRHPFLGPLTGRAGSFTIPDHGEASANTWYRVQVTVTDENGLTDTKTVNVFPVKSQMTFNSNIPGLTLFLDGNPIVAPRVVEGVENFKREISAPATQKLNGKIYYFQGWSDGGAPRHTITTPTNDTTYTATFAEAPSFTGEYFNNPNLQGAPVLTRQDAEIEFIWGQGSPAANIPNDQFSARWTKNQFFAAGKYRFITATDDGLRLFIDGQPVIDRFQNGVMSESAVVTLAAGNHEIRMEYLEGFGDASARLTWELTADQPTQTTDYVAQYYNNRTLTGAPVLTRNEATIDNDWGNGSPAPAINTDNFSARWTKTAELAAGTYDFTVTGDDGVRVIVDGETIINRFIDQGPTTYTAQKALTAGSHVIIVEYYEAGGGAVARFNYSLNTTPPPPTGDTYTAQFFNNRTLTGAPVLTRNDTAINFDWAGGSPDPVVTNDNFSARWTRSVALTAGTYEFSVTGDDGVRVIVDGETIIDRFIDQAPTTYRISKTLAAGNHTVIVEYYEAGGGAVAQFSYAPTNTPPPPPTGAYNAEYFNNMTLTGPATVVRSDAAIDFDWGGGSPDAAINANNYSARWTRSVALTAGTYEFTATADDGIRVIVDGEALINRFVDQGPTTYTAQKALAAGNHTIVVEYYENGGGAIARFNYALVDATPPPPSTTAYQARFWNLAAPATAPAIPVTAPTVTREDASIDFDWAGGSPAIGINTDGFVAQWTRTITFTAGNYRFSTESDDGIRVFIDNQPIIDQWNDHAATVFTSDRTVTAGDHVIRVEYYERGGGAEARFSYAPVTAPAPGATFTSEFFNNMTLTGAPVLTRNDTTLNFNLGAGSPDPLVNADGFSARFTKTRQFAAGTYNFRLETDDGVRFYIDDQLIVNDWTDHARTVYTPTVTLTEGQHTLRIEYFDNLWDAIMIFQEL